MYWGVSIGATPLPPLGYPLALELGRRLLSIRIFKPFDGA